MYTTPRSDQINQTFIEVSGDILNIKLLGEEQTVLSVVDLLNSIGFDVEIYVSKNVYLSVGKAETQKLSEGGREVKD